MLQNYLACGENSANAIDFYGLNAYEWSVWFLTIYLSSY